MGQVQFQLLRAIRISRLPTPCDGVLQLADVGVVASLSRDLGRRKRVKLLETLTLTKQSLLQYAALQQLRPEGSASIMTLSVGLFG